MSTLGSGIRLLIFSVVTALVTGLLAMTITNYDGQQTTSYRAFFTDASNLVNGDEVRDAGVRVGTVTGVSLSGGRRALVDFTVSSSVPLTTTTTVAIRYRNLIGQRYLAVEDGPPGGTTIPAGGQVLRTQNALNLTTLFNGFQPLLQGLSPGDLNTLSYDLVRVLQGEGGTVDALLSHVGSLSNNLADHDALIGSAISDLDQVLGPVTTHDQQLSALVLNLQRFVSGLSQDRHAIGASLAGINSLAHVTGSLLQQARPAVRTDIKQLGLLAEKLDSRGSQHLLQHFLSYTPFKMQVAIPEVTYGAFLNFYVCAANMIEPDGKTTQWFYNKQARCRVHG